MKKKKSEPDVTEPVRPTIWDVARRSGVSTATVSRVLNGQTYVSAETRDRVLHVVRELSYVNSRQASTSATAHPAFISITSISMQMAEYAQILSGITEALHAHNARPVVCPIARRHNCGLTLQERLIYKFTEGGLLLGSTDDEAELLTTLHSGFPLVIIHPTAPVSEDIPCVATSDWHAAKTATDYLISLGHQRIALLTHQDSFFHSADRLAGFQSALLTAGLALQGHFLYEGSGDPKQAGYDGALQLLSLPEAPTAILAVNDAIAVGVLQAAQALQKIVPRDLSVIGFDDLEMAKMALPELTTMHQPFVEMGRVGVDMLYRLIEGRPLDATRIELTARLVIRGSTAPLLEERRTSL